MNRRRWLTGAFATTAAAFLSACGEASWRLSEQARRMGEGLTRRVQRLIIPRDALAPTYSRAEISPDFRANGSIDPAASDYRALKADGFAGYRLVVDGLVERPLSLSLEELRARPAQTQITKHDCVEGWTSIGEWTGVRLETLLDAVAREVGELVRGDEARFMSLVAHAVFPPPPKPAKPAPDKTSDTPKDSPASDGA